MPPGNPLSKRSLLAQLLAAVACAAQLWRWVLWQPWKKLGVPGDDARFAMRRSSFRCVSGASRATWYSRTAANFCLAEWFTWHYRATPASPFRSRMPGNTSAPAEEFLFYCEGEAFEKLSLVRRDKLLVEPGVASRRIPSTKELFMQISFPAPSAFWPAVLATSLGVTSMSTPAPVKAQTSSLPVQDVSPGAIVDALKTVAGNPPKVRASFAKGQCVRGTFTPSSEVFQVTRSASFTRPSAVLGRFSIGGGNPKVADNNRTVLRGLAFKLGPQGATSDILVENAPVHFAKSMEQMLRFLQARAPGPDGKPDAARVQTFSEANPETLNQAHYVAARPLPGSFAGTVYWGVHSFPATNAKGETRFIKFKIVPVAGEVTLSDEDAKAKQPDFLMQDLEDRIAKGGFRFDVLALLGRPGDPTMDVTQRWPDEDARVAVRLGTITITALEHNAPCDGTIFNPANLADGIGHPPDEMFEARQAAYAVSLGKRRSD